jgi:hypothetical protein
VVRIDHLEARHLEAVRQRGPDPVEAAGERAVDVGDVTDLTPGDLGDAVADCRRRPDDRAVVHLGSRRQHAVLDHRRRRAGAHGDAALLGVTDVAGPLVILEVAIRVI